MVEKQVGRVTIALLAGVLGVSAQEKTEEYSIAEVNCCEHSRLNTGDASPLGKGAVQLQFNAGYGYSSRQWDASGNGIDRNRADSWEIGPVLTYGVRDDLDLGIGFGYAWLRDKDSGLQRGQGLTDVAVSAKWCFYEDKDLGLAMAYLPTLTIPTGEQSSATRLGPGQEFWSLDTRFAVVKDWSERWSSNLDFGYESAFGDREDFRGSLSANMALGYQFLPWLQPELELNYNHDLIANDRDADWVAVTAGVVLPVSELLCVRTGIQQAVAGRNTDQSTAFLLSVDMNF